MRAAWVWCLKYLPEDRTNRYLVVTVVVSVLPDGSAQLTYVKRRDWLRMKAQHAVEMN